MKGGEDIRSNIIITIFLSFSLIIGGCSRKKSYDGSYQALEPSKSIDKSFDKSIARGVLLKDISYKNVDGINLTLDIYTPLVNNSGPSPALVYVQGQNWSSVYKDIPSNLEPVISQLRERGYTIITIEYRGASKDIKYPEPVKDVKDALRWVYKNASTYSIDTDNIGILGMATGAHLAMLAAYSDYYSFKGSEELYGYPSYVDYVVDFFGPTDFLETTTEPIFSKAEYFMGSLSEDTTVLQEASPLYYINKTTPRTLIIHGTSDGVIPISQSMRLFSEGKDKGANFQLITLKSSKHDFSDASALEILNLLKNVFNFIEKDSP